MYMYITYEKEIYAYIIIIIFISVYYIHIYKILLLTKCIYK